MKPQIRKINSKVTGTNYWSIITGPDHFALFTSWDTACLAFGLGQDFYSSLAVRQDHMRIISEVA